MSSQIISLSDNGPSVIFLPANGIYYTAYNQFLSCLFQKYSVSTVIYPPLLNNQLEVPNNLKWNLFSDIIDANFNADRNIVGVGHSLGGTVLLYNALLHPDRFSHLFIIEPALFHPLF